MWYIEYLTDGGWRGVRDLSTGSLRVYETHQQAEDVASSFRHHKIKKLDKDCPIVYNIYSIEESYA